MEENKKLSVYTKKELSELQKEDNAFVAGFKTEVDNYKIPVSSFLSKADIVNAVDQATYTLRFDANDKSSTDTTLYGWKICSTYTQNLHNTSWLDFIITTNRWTGHTTTNNNIPNIDSKLVGFCRISQRLDGTKESPTLKYAATLNTFIGQPGKWKIIAYNTGTLNTTDWYLYCEGGQKYAYQELNIQILRQSEESKPVINSYFEKGKQVISKNAALTKSLDTSNIVYSVNASIALTISEDMSNTNGNFYTLSGNSANIKKSNKVILKAPGNISYKDNNTTSAWSGDNNPSIIFINNDDKQSAAFVFSDYNATTKTDNPNYSGVGSVLLTGYDSNYDKNHGRWYFKSYAVSAEHIFANSAFYGNLSGGLYDTTSTINFLKWSSPDIKKVTTANTNPPTTSASCYLAAWEKTTHGPDNATVNAVHASAVQVGSAVNASTATNAKSGYNKTANKYMPFGKYAFIDTPSLNLTWKYNNTVDKTLPISFASTTASDKDITADINYDSAFTYNPHDKRLNVDNIRLSANDDNSLDISSKSISIHGKGNNRYHFITFASDSPTISTNDNFKFGGSAWKAGSAASAASADALTKAAGSTIQPIYIDNNGKPQTCSFYFV